MRYFLYLFGMITSKFYFHKYLNKKSKYMSEMFKIIVERIKTEEIIYNSDCNVYQLIIGNIKFQQTFELGKYNYPIFRLFVDEENITTILNKTERKMLRKIFLYLTFSGTAKNIKQESLEKRVIEKLNEKKEE